LAPTAKSSADLPDGPSLLRLLQEGWEPQVLNQPFALSAPRMDSRI
jgi:hypothetical protein